MAWMIKHCQLVMANKGVALMDNYGLEEENDQFKDCLTNSIYSMCSSTASGEMRSSSMLLVVCGTYGLQF